MWGQISKIVADRGFGFIRNDEGQEFFFHQSALQGVDFGELADGTPVEFDVKPEATGDKETELARAVSIRLAENALPAADHEPLPPAKTR